MPKKSWQSSSRARAQRAIMNTAMLVFLISLPTFTHASPTDGCRGNCDQFRDRFCEEWIGSCNKCLISSENAKCVAYFKSLEESSHERPPSPSTGQEPSTDALPSVTSSSAQPIRTSPDELTNEDGLNGLNPTHLSDKPDPPSKNLAKQGDPSEDQADQYNTQSKNPARPKNSDTRPRSQEVPNDRDPDGAAVGGEESFGSLFTLKISLASIGSLVVVVTGGFVIRRRRRNSQQLTAATVEGQQNANEAENQALNPTQACQEQGAAGGTVVLPNTDLYVKNEAHGHGGIMETEL